MDKVDEGVLLSDSGGAFLSLFLVGRRSSLGCMPNFSLFNLVRG